MVAGVTVAVVVVLVAKVLVWNEAVVNILVQGLDIIAVNVRVGVLVDVRITLGFGVTDVL